MKGRFCLGFLGVFFVQACAPTVTVKSDEPITINLNVKIDHEIVLRVDQELEDLFEEDEDIF